MVPLATRITSSKLFFLIKVILRLSGDFRGGVITSFAQIHRNHFSPVLPLHRNQSIDLLCKSMDWFLINSSTGLKWINLCHSNVPFIQKPVS